jgi:Family of unknown function (DUF5317)
VLVIAGCLAALLSPLAAGRGLLELLRIRLRGLPLVWAALLTQVGVVELPMPEALAVTTHLASYLLAAAFLWLNRAVRGLPVVALGAACNGVTIALNGGTLPASAQAVRRAGISADEQFLNSAVLPHPVLPWLGDVFAWPQPLPLANVFSVGDVLIVLGVGLVAWGASRPGRRRERVGRRAAGLTESRSAEVQGPVASGAPR